MTVTIASDNGGWAFRMSFSSLIIEQQYLILQAHLMNDEVSSEKDGDGFVYRVGCFSDRTFRKRSDG